MMNLKTMFIEANENGSMNVNNLKENLLKLKKQEHLNFIISINFGTTSLAGFDDIKAIKECFEAFKNVSWEYLIHVDAALYGPTFLILN